MRLWVTFLASMVLAAAPAAAQFNRGAGHSTNFSHFGNPQPIPGSALNGVPGIHPGVSVNGLPAFSNNYVHYPCPGCSLNGQRGFGQRGYGRAGYGYGLGYVPFVPLFDGYDFGSTFTSDQGSAPPPAAAPAADPATLAMAEQIGELRGELNQLRSQNAPPASSPDGEASNQPAEPATVIVLRGGQSLETTNYAVMDGMLWNFSARPVQKIPLSSIDLPASQKANAARGVDFSVSVTASN